MLIFLDPDTTNMICLILQGEFYEVSMFMCVGGGEGLGVGRRMNF